MFLVIFEITIKLKQTKQSKKGKAGIRLTA